jgi:hypothetical protein
MADLISADIVVPLKQRMAEFRESLEGNYSTALLEGDEVLAGPQVPADALESILSGGESESNLGAMVSRCIDDCLVSVQKLRSLADLKALSATGAFVGCYGEKIENYGAESDAGEEGARQQAVILRDCVTLSVSSLAACQVQKVTASLTAIHRNLTLKLDRAPAAERSAAITVLSALTPVVQQLTQAFCALLDGVVMQYKSVGKLLYVTVRIFRTLLSKGICSATVEDGEGEGSGDLSGMLFEDDVEGTGMGEGEGKKDVSDQIENEEQLLGLKDDVPKDGGKHLVSVSISAVHSVPNTCAC